MVSLAVAQIDRIEPVTVNGAIYDFSEARHGQSLIGCAHCMHGMVKLNRSAHSAWRMDLWLKSLRAYRRVG